MAMEEEDEIVEARKSGIFNFATTNLPQVTQPPKPIPQIVITSPKETPKIKVDKVKTGPPAKQKATILKNNVPQTAKKNKLLPPQPEKKLNVIKNVGVKTVNVPKTANVVIPKKQNYFSPGVFKPNTDPVSLNLIERSRRLAEARKKTRNAVLPRYNMRQSTLQQRSNFPQKKVAYVPHPDEKLREEQLKWQNYEKAREEAREKARLTFERSIFLTQICFHFIKNYIFRSPKKFKEGGTDLTRNK